MHGIDHHLLQGSNLTAKFDPRAFNATKTKLVSEAFRSRAPIRKALKQQCLASPDQCSHTEPSSRLSNAAFSELVHKNDMAAWFSLQPPGDTNVQPSSSSHIVAGINPVAAPALNCVHFNAWLHCPPSACDATTIFRIQAKEPSALCEGQKHSDDDVIFAQHFQKALSLCLPRMPCTSTLP